MLGVLWRVLNLQVFLCISGVLWGILGLLWGMLGVTWSIMGVLWGKVGVLRGMLGVFRYKKLLVYQQILLG